MGVLRAMTEDWTIEFEGFEFTPIPKSWLEHRYAEDRRDHEGPRLFAVSAATYGRQTLRVRYGEPRTGNVLVMRQPARKRNNGVVPESLQNGTRWARSRSPPPRVQPRDVLRAPEQEHLRALWADTGLLPDPPYAVADGGESV